MRSKRSLQWLACLCLPLGFAAIVLGVVSGSQRRQDTAPLPSPTAQPEVTAAPTPTPGPVTQTVRFSASGDDLIHEGLYNQARDRAGGNGYDFTFAYENLRDFYAGFDINWLNQETLVNNAFAPSGYPMFSTPGDITNALYDIGFRVFSLSNNHSYDKGAAGIASSREVWASMPDDVRWMGLYNLDTYDDYVYQTVNGITFGYLSYTEYTNGLPTPADSQYGVVYLSEQDIIARQIADMRPNCDVLVISCHWGVEGSHEVNDFQRQTAQWLVDQGADLIIGTHPHVTQTAEWMTAADGHTAFVTYSLGNFISAQAQADNMIGAILDVSFEKTTQPDGAVSLRIVEPKLRPVITQYESGYRDIRVYLYPDYTEELGAAHGNFQLSRAYIQSVLESSIDAAFLALE